MTPKRILVTRALTDTQMRYAQALGLEPVVEPALRIEYTVNPEKLLKKLDRFHNEVWVFTSQNGAEALRRVQESEFRIKKIPAVYAVGEKTAETLAEIGIKAKVPDQQNAVGLAELISRDFLNNKPDIIHWCGNRRRDELGDQLKDAGFRYFDFEVYQTELNNIRIPEVKTDAILFYSPSAVEAFRRSGGFDRNLPELIAIGSTTGEALSLESGKHVHIPSEPSTEALLELAAEILGTELRSNVPLRRGIKGDDKPNFVKANYKEISNNLNYNKSLKDLARILRNESTRAEIRLWTESLRAGKMHGYSFLRQRPVLNYIADFMCKELNLIIELDGYSHSFEQQWKKDLDRQKELENAGFTILRFHDEEVMNDLRNVERVIESWIEDQKKNKKSPPSKGD
jgi:uroporphyrinogen-III synthase